MFNLLNFHYYELQFIHFQSCKRCWQHPSTRASKGLQLQLPQYLNNVEVDEVEEFDLDDYAYDYHTGNPAVYVGTYHKYNCGSIFGKWLDLTAFADYDEFIAVCRYLHRDEADLEFMAQDYENFPAEWYTEGFMIREQFEHIQEFAELDEDEREAYEAF